MTTTETTTPLDAMRANIPAELPDLDQWVTWKYEQRPGEKKPTKVLYNPTTGQRADSTDPRTWSTFDDAGRVYERGGYDGVGFVLTDDDPYSVADLDGCIVNGELTDNANRWLLLLDSYTEITPSGAGLRVWVKGRKPGPRCKNAKLGIEIYEAGRFLTVTGNRLVDLPTTINERQSELEALYNEVFPPKDESGDNSQSAPSVAVLSMDDQELVNRMLRKPEIAALWNGDKSAYMGSDGKPDDSNADMALCSHLAYFTSCDPARIDRLFRQSGLYRPKWERQDYRDRTINKAIAGCKGNYDPANYRSNGHSNMGNPSALVGNKVTFGANGHAHTNGAAPPPASSAAGAGAQQNRAAVNGTSTPLSGACSLYNPPIQRISIFQFQRAMKQKAKSDYKLDFVIDCARETEVGDGRLVAHVMAGWVVYDHSEAMFYFFNGLHWEADKADCLPQIASDISTTMYLQASRDKHDEYLQLVASLAGATPNDQQRKVLDRIDREKKLVEGRAAAMFKRKSIMNALSFSQSGLHLGVSGDIWDTNIELLGVANGIISLVTGKAVQPDPKQYIRTVTTTPYIPNATRPQWEKALREILDNNDDKFTYLKRFLGYALSGTCRHAEFLIWYGEHGQNGKEFILERVKNALGDKLTGVIDRELFLKNSHARVAGSSNESMISLRGRRIVWASETEEGRRMSLANMKDLSGSHIMEAIPKYGKQVQWKRTHTPILLTNFLPKVESQGLAEWTRIRVLRFKLSFIDTPDPAKPWERKVDPMLGNRIDETELSGVLSFLVEGCTEWYQHGLQTPDCVRRDTTTYKQDEDTIALFIKERCTVDKGQRCKTTELYKAYKFWHDLAEHGKLKGKKEFYADVEENKGFDKKDIHGSEHFVGIDVTPTPVQVAQAAVNP